MPLLSEKLLQRGWLMTTLLATLCTSCGAEVGLNSDAPHAHKAERVEVERFLRAAEVALPRVPVARRAALRAGVQRARKALDRHHELLQQGSGQRKAEGALSVTGMALLADDSTGFGIADNVLLPFVMLGMVAVHLSMDPPASTQRLGESWSEVIEEFTEVAQLAGADILQALERVPPKNQCAEHYGSCLATPLGKRNSGGRHGHSICKDCLDRCRDGVQWPDRTWDGKSCQWWQHVEGLQP